MGLAAIACVDEQWEDNVIDTTPGNEIVFTAMAGGENIATKTEYGEVNKENKTIAINWKHGDRIQIVCPEASGSKNAEYRISTTDEKNNSVAASLTKTSDAGLQWSNAIKHNFYAMYPSPASTVATSDAIHEQSKTMIGSIPVVQTESSLVTTQVDNKNFYEYKPDMNYAYMVAMDSYENAQNGDDVSLNFQPLFTSFQFDISIPSIGSATVDKQIWIKSITLKSKTQKLSGEFLYDFKDGKVKLNSEAASADSIMVSFENHVPLSAGEQISVSLFALPISSWAANAKDLVLAVEYMNGGKLYRPRTTITAAITARKKHHFKSIQLPEIGDMEITGGSWMEALDENTILATLSIPVAGNAFTSYYQGDDAPYFREQVLSIEKLWNLGVRGFEFSTSLGHTPGTQSFTGTLENEYFVCNGTELASAKLADGKDLTFKNAFNYLVEQVTGTNECAIIIATYKPYGGDSPDASNGGGYKPQIYINHLTKFLTDCGLKEDQFVALTSSTTIKQVKGKLVVIVRPGDFEYIAMDTDNTTIALSSENPALTIVENWGTSVDCWDRRFEDCARQAVYAQAGKTINGVTVGSKYVDNYLYTGTTSSSQPTMPTGYSSLVPSPNYTFNTKTGDIKSTMHIQEWARVVREAILPWDSGLDYKTSFIGRTNNNVWLQWPESLSEKKEQIMDTLDESAKMQTVCINSLCGYYVSKNHNYSFYPYTTRTTSTGIVGTANIFDNAGRGGDIAGLAADLNTFFYQEILQRTESKTLGSMGLVMMNYIGASASDFANADHIPNESNQAAIDAETASKQLPGLILMSNFKNKANLATTSYDAVYENGGEAISFK